MTDVIFIVVLMTGTGTGMFCVLADYIAMLLF